MLEFRLELIGRKAELSFLLEHLERARAGRGSTFLISGEAGIGKTRLLAELKIRAGSIGVQVLAGSSLYESLTPYMPFLEALRSGGLEHLLVEHAPRLEGMYFLTDAGLLIKSVVRAESTTLDSDVFAGMLTTVNDFVRDSLARLRVKEREATMRRLDYGDYSILLERLGRTMLVAVVTGKETEFLVNDMRDALAEADRIYGERLRRWDGDEDGISAVADLLSPLLEKYDGASYENQNPKAKRDLLFESVALGLVRRAQSNPILLCLEDLQWADPSTLALFHYVSRSAGEGGLMIVGTFRPEDLLAADGANRILSDIIFRMDRENLLQKMELERMSEGTTTKLVTSVLGHNESVRELAQIIHREGEGNPLFSLELVRLMIEDEILLEKNGSWKLVRPLSEWRIPTKIRDTILRRVDRAGDELRTVLDYACVIGEEFSSDVLASALTVDRPWLLRALRTLEVRHSLIHPRGDRYRFHHVKIKDVLYSELPAELRREYHETIATAIEKLGEPDLDAVAGDLAFHYARGKNRGKALRYLLRAAELAKERYSNEEAIQFYRQALDLARDPQERLGVLENLGSVQNRVGFFRESIASYRAALEAASAMDARVRILTKLGAVLAALGELEESNRVCREALGFVQGQGSLEEALALHNLGFSYRMQGELGPALDCLERSLKIRQNKGDGAGAAKSLFHIGMVYENRGEFDRAAEFYQQSLRISEESGAESPLMMALLAVGMGHHQRDEFESALQYFGRSLALAEKIGDREWAAECLGNIGVVHLDRGDYDKALDSLGKAVRIGEKTDNESLVACVLPILGLIRAERGDQEAALADCGRSLRFLEGTSSSYDMGQCLLFLGKVHLIGGDDDEALLRFRSCEETARAIGARGLVAMASSGIAEIYLNKGDLEGAGRYAEQCSTEAARTGSLNLEAEAECILGMVHREQGNFDESIKNFERCIGFREGTGFLAKLRKPHYEFGLMWKKLEDVERARGQLEKSLTISEKLGTPMASERARRALRDIST